ncbi:hypothetical protein CEE39_00545 [bacterium (candidate division B38) B3_B38]|nr:MAG: hypothetical protein CEE39_00545 [bacterium (candidate division B38) B3_B38]
MDEVIDLKNWRRGLTIFLFTIFYLFLSPLFRENYAWQEERGAKFRKLWEFQVGEATNFTSSIAILTQPICDAEKVYFASENGTFYALNIVSGERVWEFTAGSPVRQSATLGDHSLFVATSGMEALSLDLITGNLRWRRRMDGEIFTPLIFNKGALYFGFSRYIACLRASDGEEIWRFETGDEVHAPPIIEGEFLYAGSDDGFLYALTPREGRLRWKFSTSGKIVAAPLLFEGTLFVGSYDNYIYALHPDSGKQKWKKITGGDVNCRPIGWEKWVFVSSLDNFLYCLQVKNGYLSYRFRLPYRLYHSPVISGDLLFMAPLSDTLVVIDPINGEKVGGFTAPSLITSPPGLSPNGDIIFIGTNKGLLIALKLIS